MKSLRWVRVRLGVISVHSSCRSKESKSNNQPEESEGSESSVRTSSAIVREGFVIVVIRWASSFVQWVVLRNMVRDTGSDKLKESMIDQDESEIIRRLNLLVSKKTVRKNFERSLKIRFGISSEDRSL